jgi:hypothetical protein
MPCDPQGFRHLFIGLRAGKAMKGGDAGIKLSGEKG